MTERFTFSRDQHGGITLDASTLQAFYRANRPGVGMGVATRVPRALQDHAMDEFVRVAKTYQATTNRTYEEAMSFAISTHRELFFLSQCSVADSDRDADVSLQVAR